MPVTTLGFTVTTGKIYRVSLLWYISLNEASKNNPMDDRSYEGTRPKRTIHFSTNWTLKAIGPSRDMQIPILILTAALAVCATATAERGNKVR